MAAPVAGCQTPWVVLGKLYEAGFMNLWVMPLPQLRPAISITGWRNLTPDQLRGGFTFLIFANNVVASMQELSAHIFQGKKVQVMVEEHTCMVGGIKIQWLMYPEGYDVESIPEYY